MNSKNIDEIEHHRLLREAIKEAVRSERERIALLLEEDADLCANVNVATIMISCAKTVRNSIRNSFTDHRVCTRTQNGNHAWAEICAACGEPKESIDRSQDILNEDYCSNLLVIDRLETKILELEAKLASCLPPSEL